MGPVESRGILRGSDDGWGQVGRGQGQVPSLHLEAG